MNKPVPLKQPFIKELEPLAYSRRLSEVFDDFVTVAACCLSPRINERDESGALKGMREEDYLRVIKRYDRKGVDQLSKAFAELVIAMEEEPFTDPLGPVHMELQSGSSAQRGGEFYTPFHVSEMIARMTMTRSSFPQDRPLECNEPACGAGGMILASAKAAVELGVSPLRMRWVAQDISKLGCDMCFINTSLSGVPTEVVHGNTLSLEEWSRYPNVFWPAARGEDSHERLARVTLELLKGDRHEEVSKEDVEAQADKKEAQPVVKVEEVSPGRGAADAVAERSDRLGKNHEQGGLF